jgi:hypothetical protein
MSEKPILFSATMVRAILAGLKTQTRRIVKIPGLDFRGGGGKDGPDWNDPSCWGFETDAGDEWALSCGELVDFVLPPPYTPGQTLWVRETAWYDDAFGGRCFFADGTVTHADGSPASRTPHPCSAEMLDACGLQRKRPSIFMPRWASRITLRVVSVRPERLQAISEADAVEEGVDAITGKTPRVVCGTPIDMNVSAREMFATLWDSINGKKHPWDSNPWVWRIEFKRVEA